MRNSASDIFELILAVQNGKSRTQWPYRSPTEWSDTSPWTQWQLAQIASTHPSHARRGHMHSRKIFIRYSSIACL